MLDSIERALYWLGSFVLEGDSDAHCQLRAPLSDDTLITINEDLMSVIDLRGSRKLVGDSEFEIQAANLGQIMAKVMKGANGRQHSFGVGFRSSPASAPRLLREIFAPNMATARRLGAKNTVIYANQIAAMAKRCSDESVYLILYTHRSGLSPNDQKRAETWRAEAGEKLSKAAPGSRYDDRFTQSPRAPYHSLVPRHNATLTNLLSDLGKDIVSGGAGLLVSKLDVGVALTTMRRQLDAGDFPSSWRPRLIGGKSTGLPSIPPRARDASSNFPIRIGRQLVTEPTREIFGDVEIAKRGDYYYASLVLEVPPEEGSEPFKELARRIQREHPWSVNFEIVPNGEKLRKGDQFYAGFMGAFGDYNRRVKDGWKELRRLKNEGVYVAAIRVIFTTWEKTEDELVSALSLLRSSLESWGSSVVTNETGSPGLASLCSAAGYSKRMPAPYLPLPIAEVCRMLPLRPSSVWDSGQLVAHTEEGRPYPVAFGSTEQAFWGTLIFAPPGLGKSFAMNMINLGIMLSAGLEELPYLTVVDVGPSSRLVMDYVRALLPPHRARQVVSLRIRNEAKFCVNILDTQHGCDGPTKVDKDFQIAMISTLCPSLGPEGEKYIAAVIDAAYRAQRRSSPTQRTWQAAFDPKVNEALEAIGFEVGPKTRAWEVVDALFAAGRIDDSARAQRYAVPKLADLVKASSDKEILDAYASHMTPNQELIQDVFTRNIGSAMREYELINGYTQFELANARAISIDLEEVVTGNESEEGKRRAAMMFLFGRRLGAKNYFLRWEEIEDLVPDQYKAYQQDRITKLEETLKFLEYDEVHYASGMVAMSRRIQEDLRVGRKYNCVTMMASQLLEDFPKAAVENCYNYFILGVGTDIALDNLQRTFSLSPSEAYAIQSECTGPGKMFGLFKTNKGNTSQVLHTRAGSTMSWAFNTSKSDALLRTGVVKAVGEERYLEAIDALARVFPSGTARDDMELYRRSKGDTSTGDTTTEVFVRRVLQDIALGARKAESQAERA